MSRLPRPRPSEYAEYYRGYVDLVPDGDILEILAAQMGESRALLSGVPPERERHRYAPGKWSVREVVGHVWDTEWVFLYRALSMGRGDETSLPGMDQDVWAAGSGAHEHPLAELASGWAALRAAGIAMLGTLDAEAGARSGRASDNPFTVRSFAWIIAGHERHHMARLRADYLDG